MAEKDKNINPAEDVTGSSEDEREDMQGASAEDLERTAEDENAARGAEGGSDRSSEGGAEERVGEGVDEEFLPWLFLAASDEDSGYTPPNSDRYTDIEDRFSDTSVRVSDPDSDQELPPMLRMYRSLNAKKDGPFFGLLRQKRGYMPYFFAEPTGNPFGYFSPNRERNKDPFNRYEGPFLLAIPGPARRGNSGPSTSENSGPSTRENLEFKNAPRKIMDPSDDCESNKSKNISLDAGRVLEDIMFYDSESSCKSSLSEGSSESTLPPESSQSNSTSERSSGYAADESSLTSSDGLEYLDFSAILHQTKKIRKGSQSNLWHQAMGKRTRIKSKTVLEKHYETGPFIPVEGPFLFTVAGPSTGEATGPSTGEAAGPSTGEAAGPSTGEAAGPSTGEAAGPSTGGAAGSSKGQKATCRNILYLPARKDMNISNDSKSSKKLIPLKLGIRLGDMKVFDTEDLCKSNSQSESSSKSSSPSGSPKTDSSLESSNGYEVNSHKITCESEFSGSKNLHGTEGSQQGSQSILSHQAVRKEPKSRKSSQICYETGSFIPVEGPFLIALPEASCKEISGTSSNERSYFGSMILLSKEGVDEKKQQRELKKENKRTSNVKENSDEKAEAFASVASISPERSTKKTSSTLEETKKRKQESHRVSSPNKKKLNLSLLEPPSSPESSSDASCSKTIEISKDLKYSGKQKRYSETSDWDTPKSKVEKIDYSQHEISSGYEFHGETSKMVATQPLEHSPVASASSKSYPEPSKMSVQKISVGTFKESLSQSAPVVFSTPDASTEDTNSSTDSKKESSTNGDK